MMWPSAEFVNVSFGDQGCYVVESKGCITYFMYSVLLTVIPVCKPRAKYAVSMLSTCLLRLALLSSMYSVFALVSICNVCSLWPVRYL